MPEPGRAHARCCQAVALLKCASAPLPGDVAAGAPHARPRTQCTAGVGLKRIKKSMRSRVPNPVGPFGRQV